METTDFLSLSGPEVKRVDLVNLKSKIISADLLLKKFQEKEAECNQLKILKRRLESECTTYERELKQLLPAKNALEEYKIINQNQGSKINELEDQLKATSVITEQFRELAKVKEAETEEYKGLATVGKKLQVKEKQLFKTKENVHKLQDEVKKLKQDLKSVKSSYNRALKTFVGIVDNVEIKNLNKSQRKEVKVYKTILSSGNQDDHANGIIDIVDSDDGEPNDGLQLEMLLQEGSPPRVIKNDPNQTEMCSNLSDDEEWVEVTPTDSNETPKNLNIPKPGDSNRVGGKNSVDNKLNIPKPRDSNMVGGKNSVDRKLNIPKLRDSNMVGVRDSIDKKLNIPKPRYSNLVGGGDSVDKELSFPKPQDSNMVGGGDSLDNKLNISKTGDSNMVGAINLVDKELNIPKPRDSNMVGGGDSIDKELNIPKPRDSNMVGGGDSIDKKLNIPKPGDSNLVGGRDSIDKELNIPKPGDSNMVGAKISVDKELNIPKPGDSNIVGAKNSVDLIDISKTGDSKLVNEKFLDDKILNEYHKNDEKFPDSNEEVMMNSEHVCDIFQEDTSIEHHTYALSPNKLYQKKKLSTSPAKTTHEIGLPAFKTSQIEPDVILDNGVSNSVTIGDIQIFEPELNIESENLVLDKNDAVNVESFQTDKIIMPLDPNLPNSSEDATMEDLTVPEPMAISTSPVKEQSSNKIEEVLYSRIIYEVVEFLVSSVCTTTKKGLDELLAVEAIDETTNLDTEVMNIMEGSLSSSKIKEKKNPKMKFSETELEFRTAVSTVISESVLLQESTSVKKAKSDELKTSLRRVKRITRRMSLNLVSDRPISPLPPSPIYSPTESFFESTFSMEETEEDSHIVNNLNDPGNNSNGLESNSNDLEKILHNLGNNSNDLDDLFGSDTDESIDTPIPPKPFQHQDSQGFDPEAIIPHLDSSKNVSLQCPSSTTVPKRKISTSNSKPQQPIQHCPNITPSNHQNVKNTQRNDHSANELMSNRPNPYPSYTPTNSLTDNQRYHPYHGTNRLTPTREFNSKLKANFSHNADTGNYSISIRLPDTSNPIKNMHFEIDTITNEFSLNFNPGAQIAAPPDNPLLNNVSRSVQESGQRNVSPSMESHNDSAYNSTQNLDETNCDEQVASNSTSRVASTSLKSKNSIGRKNSDIPTPRSLLKRNQGSYFKDGSEKRVSVNKPFSKNSNNSSTIKPISPFISSLINAKKLSEKTSKTSLLQDKNTSIKRPFLKNDSKLKKDKSVVLIEPLPLFVDPKHTESNVSPEEPIEPAISTEQDIPVLQPMIAKRVSHCNKIDKEMPILTKKVETDVVVKPSTSLKRKLSPQSNRKISLDEEVNSKKICIEICENKEQTTVSQFWSSVSKPLDRNLAIEGMLNAFFKLDTKDKKIKNDISQDILNQLLNPKLVPSSQSLIEAILFHSVKNKKNPFSSTKKGNEFLAPWEKGLVAFLFYLQEHKPLFKNIILEFKERSISFCFNDQNHYLFGLAGICRLLTLVCKEDGDLQMGRMLCFNFMVEKLNIALYMIANIVTTWPQVLPFGVKSIFKDTVIKLLLNTNLETSMSGVLKAQSRKFIRKYCEIEDQPDLKIVDMVNELTSIYHDINATEENLAEAGLCFLILSSYRGWEWTFNELITNHILPFVENRASNCVKNTKNLLCILGKLIKNCPSESIKTVSHVINIYLNLLNEESEDIRDCVLFNLVQLNSNLDSSQSTKLKNWICSHSEDLNPKFLINNLTVEEIKKKVLGTN